MPDISANYQQKTIIPQTITPCAIEILQLSTKIKEPLYICSFPKININTNYKNYKNYHL